MSDSYFRFFPGDYLRDTGDLTLVEHGAYLMLLAHYYMKESLPADRDRCLRIAKAFTQAEAEAVDAIIARFFYQDGDALRNKRADAEIEERKAFISAQSERGRKGAEARWNKSEVVAQAMAQALPTPILKQCLDDGQPSPSPSPDPSPTEILECVITHSSTNGENGDCPHEQIITLYHEMLPMMPKVRVWPETNKKILRARWKEKTERRNIEWWKGYFEFVGASDYLTGKVNDWTANLEWLVRPKNMTKVINGVYHKEKHGGIKSWLRETENDLRA